MMPSTKKIVVLEDDRSTGALVSAILEKEGYQVSLAVEGRSAVEMVIKERPALLVSDVLVPDMNGSEVVKTIRGLSFGEEQKTLFLTSLLDKGEETDRGEQILRLEGAEYPALAKPFKPKVLVELVRRLAGDPKEEIVEAEIEASVETQAEEAEKAIASSEESESADSENANETTESSESEESVAAESEGEAKESEGE